MEKEDGVWEGEAGGVIFKEEEAMLLLWDTGVGWDLLCVPVSSRIVLCVSFLVRLFVCIAGA